MDDGEKTTLMQTPLPLKTHTTEKQGSHTSVK